MFAAGGLRYCRRPATRSPRLKPLARAIDRFGQPLRAERLQQIVDRVDFECLQRVLIVRGDEDHGDVAADEIEHLEAVELRHLDVEEQQIRLQFGDDLDRLEAIGALGDDSHVWHAPSDIRAAPIAPALRRRRSRLESERRCSLVIG